MDPDRTPLPTAVAALLTAVLLYALVLIIPGLVVFGLIMVVKAVASHVTWSGEW